MDIEVMLRPGTGFQKGYMELNFYKDCFTLTKEKEAMLDFNEGEKFTIPYKAISSFENNNYAWVSGIKINLNDSRIDFPASPSKAVGGLLGGLISAFRAEKKLFILYFNDKTDKQTFVDKCTDGNESIELINNDWFILK